MSEDKLERMFEMRERWMKELSSAKPQMGHATWPLDLTSKDSQRHIRDVSLRGVEEVFEALSHLKNWKPHRSTEVPEFSREEFLEEWVDAFNYFLSALILAGYSSEEVFAMYEKKDAIIHERLKSGY